jgi:hypothetical protein
MQPFGLSHDPFGRLVLIDADGVRHGDVTPVRAFPTSDPEHWISIVGSEGQELAWIEELDDLPESTRSTLEQEFAEREFAPLIRRIVNVSSMNEPSEWTVETDRGTTQFVLESDSDVRRLSRTRAVIFDSHGTRFAIEDLTELDHRSRRFLERYL